MRAPQFWHRPSVTGNFLSPLSLVWRAGACVRNSFAKNPWVAPVPVLCVGNLTAGGAGKTPLVIDLAYALSSLGHTPHLLSRGYGGTTTGPVLVDIKLHSARDIGDEPLLLAEAAPTWVSRDRIAGAKKAVENGATIIVMDDGYQNFALSKTLSILTIDGGYGFGNGRVIPAGPLRETISSGLARCDAAILIGEDRYGVAKTIEKNCPLFRARIVATPNPEVAGRKVFAFAGIARPEKFYATLQELGCDIIGTQGFPDHHKFDPDELIKICDQATQWGAIPVTTEKDYVRLPEGAQPLVKTLRISLEWEEENARERLLDRVSLNG